MKHLRWMAVLCLVITLALLAAACGRANNPATQPPAAPTLAAASAAAAAPAPDLPSLAARLPQLRTPVLLLSGERDRTLRALDARHLFEVNLTRLAIRRGTWLRGYVYAFIGLFAPRYDRAAVDTAIDGARARS